MSGRNAAALVMVAFTLMVGAKALSQAKQHAAKVEILPDTENRKWMFSSAASCSPLIFILRP